MSTSLKSFAQKSFLAILCTFALSGMAFTDEGFVSLFDGKTLKGWDGNPAFWSVQDGAITGQTTKDNPTKGNTFLTWDGEVADFELRLKFRIDGGNSGIQYRSSNKGKWVIGGYQADFDAGNGWTGSLYEEKGRGVLVKRGNKVEITADGKKKNVGTTTPEKQIIESIKKDGWNDYTIIAKGNHLIQKVNGLLTIELTDNQEEKRAMKGLLALQVHQGPPMKVQFKDIQYKKLGTSSETAAKTSAASKKRIVFVAGKRSHGYGSHEHNAGCILLAKHFQKAFPDVETEVYQNGWPSDEAAFEGASTVIIYCDGGGRHVVIPHKDKFDKLAKAGVGVGCIHYGVEVPKEAAGKEFLNWIGGYFETHWSVNPHWDADFKSFPDHPVANGVKPFKINDEWYFHMRFRDEMKGVTPILSAVAPESTMKRKDGPHSGNPHVRKAVAAGEKQHVMWVSENENNGRGFGFTGGHFHWNWGDDNFRKVVLNAIAWTAHIDVPKNGVESVTPTRSDLEANQDEAPPKKKK